VSDWIIERFLRSAQRSWSYFVAGRRVGTVGMVLCLVWFAVQLAAWRGIITRSAVVHEATALVIGAAVVALLFIFIAALATQYPRAWLAGRLEKGCSPLQDRLHALVYLEQKPARAGSPSIRRRITDQASTVLQNSHASPELERGKTWSRLGLFFFALLGVILFQRHFDPFANLQGDLPTAGAKSAPFELAPRSNVAETQARQTWGEVRIVDPGHDVRLTKVDVLPLQIEMATSDAMQNPAWVTSINGGAEVSHDLAKPSDPNYMVYQPVLYLDQLAVTDWDVVAYYAHVDSDAPGKYASPISFIEIRPFREEILKGTGGGKGNQRYDLLNELTGLIKEQTNVLQQTHQHELISYPKDDRRLQDARKLSDSENNLVTSTDHFYGKIASADENAPVGDILDELSQAQDKMTQAVPPLRDDVVVVGKQAEEGALSHLIACRKAFQKVISDHPDAFGGQSGESLADSTPTASDSLKKLSQVSEMRDRDQETMQSLHDVANREQALAQSRENLRTRLGEQMQIKSDLGDMMSKNPDLFHGAEQQQSAVRQNMMQSILSLSSGDAPAARTALAQTAASLQELEQRVGQQHQAQQVAAAYQLKKIIDQNAQQLGQEQAKPGSLSPQEVHDLADSARGSTQTLKDIVDGDRSGVFGPQLGQSLSAANQQALNNALAEFRAAPAGAGRSSAGGEAQKDLQNVGQAFEQSQPALTNQIRHQDALQPAPADALDQAEQDLQSMILGIDGHGGDAQKAGAQILDELRAGMSEKGKVGGIVQDQLLADADKLLKIKAPGEGDSAALKKLLTEIQSFRTEVNDPAQAKPPELNTTQIDPTKFPPSYRDRLRAYFEQLSQQPH
jgi:hypothetical protein